jgi:DNA polymerase-4
MSGRQATIIHVNVTDFAAAVAVARQPSLSDCAFAIAREGSSRRVVITPSARAFAEGIRRGMPVSTAVRLLPSLRLVPPDPAACAVADAEIARIAARYSPTVQCDHGGHLYLDAEGTTRLFGTSVDCAVRIRNEICDRLSLQPAVAVSTNKLVSKIGTRAIRPWGIMQIRQGEEAAFLAPQDVSLLPGVGPAIGRLLEVAGIREIGQLAALDDMQVVAFLGKRGLSLRDAARGMDSSPLDSGSLHRRRIVRRVDLAEPIADFESLRAGLICAAEEAGVSLRSRRLGCSKVSVGLVWSDGIVNEASRRTKRQWLLDRDLIAVAWDAAVRAMQRRVQIRSFTVELSDLSPAWTEPDLFEPGGRSREERLQEAVDMARSRFGLSVLTHAGAVFHG